MKLGGLAGSRSAPSILSTWHSDSQGWKWDDMAYQHLLSWLQTIPPVTDSDAT